MSRKQAPNHYISGHYGDPPATLPQDYLLVLIQIGRRMWKDIGAVLVLSLLIAITPIPKSWLLSGKAVSILGIAVSIFIGFRNTEAINRWWEARKLWGELVNYSRCWKDNLYTYIDVKEAKAIIKRLVRLQVAMIWQNNFELRNFWHPSDSVVMKQICEQIKLKPGTSVRRMSEIRALDIQKLHQKAIIDDWGRNQLVQTADATMVAIGGLQRIRNTPIPPPYDVFVRLLTWVFGSQLLLAFKHDNSLATGIALMIGFLFAERIGAYIEGPFDQDGSSFSMPQNVICMTITEDLLPEEFEHRFSFTSHRPIQWD